MESASNEPPGIEVNRFDARVSESASDQLSKWPGLHRLLGCGISNSLLPVRRSTHRLAGHGVPADETAGARVYGCSAPRPVGQEGAIASGRKSELTRARRRAGEAGARSRALDRTSGGSVSRDSGNWSASGISWSLHSCGGAAAHRLHGFRGHRRLRQHGDLPVRANRTRPSATGKGVRRCATAWARSCRRGRAGPRTHLDRLPGRPAVGPHRRADRCAPRRPPPRGRHPVVTWACCGRCDGRPGAWRPSRPATASGRRPSRPARATGRG